MATSGYIRDPAWHLDKPARKPGVHRKLELRTTSPSSTSPTVTAPSKRPLSNPCAPLSCRRYYRGELRRSETRLVRRSSRSRRHELAVVPIILTSLGYELASVPPPSPEFHLCSTSVQRKGSRIHHLGALRQSEGDENMGVGGQDASWWNRVRTSRFWRIICLWDRRASAGALTNAVEPQKTLRMLSMIH